MGLDFGSLLTQIKEIKSRWMWAGNGKSDNGPEGIEGGREGNIKRRRERVGLDKEKRLDLYAMIE